MADLRGTIDQIKKRKKAIEEAANADMVTASPSPATKPTLPVDDTDLLSPEAIEREYQKQKAAEKKKKKGWLW